MSYKMYIYVSVDRFYIYIFFLYIDTQFTCAKPPELLLVIICALDHLFSFGRLKVKVV